MTVQDRLQVPPAGEAPGVRPPARTLGAQPLIAGRAARLGSVQVPGKPVASEASEVKTEDGPGGTAISSPVLPRVTLRRLTRGTWRVSYHAVSGNEYVIGRYQNHATAQHQARAYAKVQDCPVEEAGA